MAYVPVDADEARFLEGFARRPEDHGARAVYADWLEERGDRARAEVVRRWLEREPPRVERRDGLWLPEEQPFVARDPRFAYRRNELACSPRTCASGHCLFEGCDWQRLVFDPPLPLGLRADRRWLAALLGGAEERASAGEEAPPSLLTGSPLTAATFDADLLWGWPSPALFRLAFAVARDLADACRMDRALAGAPRDDLLSAIGRLEDAVSRGATEARIERTPDPSSDELLRGPRRWSARGRAHEIVRELPPLLPELLGSYQGSRTTSSRPAVVAGIVWRATRARELLSWTHERVEHAHAVKMQALGVAEAAAVRAEKAERALASEPARLEARGVSASGRAAELTERRDRARRLAAAARAHAAAKVAACPTRRTFGEELRALFLRVAPDLVTWLRAQPDFPPEPLVVGKVEVERDARGLPWRIVYGPDGRLTATFDLDSV